MKLIFPAPSGGSKEGRHSVGRTGHLAQRNSPAAPGRGLQDRRSSGRQNVDPPYPLLWMLILFFAFLATGITASAQSSGIVEEPAEQEALTPMKERDQPGLS